VLRTLPWSALSQRVWKGREKSPKRDGARNLLRNSTVWRGDILLCKVACLDEEALHGMWIAWARVMYAVTHQEHLRVCVCVCAFVYACNAQSERAWQDVLLHASRRQ